MGVEPSSAPTTRPDWARFVEHSPIVTMSLRGADGQGDRLGEIVCANLAARTRFGLTDGDAEDVRSIFDLVESDDHDDLIAHFGNPSLSLPALPLRIIADQHAADCQVAPETVTLHLRRDPSGHFIAQMAPCDGWLAVDRVLDEQHRFRTALMELSELAHTTKDDDDFYQRLIERAVEVVPGAQGGTVLLHIPDTTSFRFVAAVDYDLAGLQHHVLEGEHFFRDAYDPGAQIVRDFRNPERTAEIDEWLETVGRLSEIVVNVSAPVLRDGAPIAFLSLDNFQDPSAMNETSVEMTSVLSRFIGELLSRRELEATVRQEREAFRQQSLHDPLTALPNRRNLERSLAEILAANDRRDRPTAVLFADIDDFKGVNDRLGHQVGDLLLIGVANALCEPVRSGDLVGRWGGDEFLVLASRLEDPAEAVTLAERVLKHFGTELELGNGSTYRARVSIGVGWTQSSDIDGDSLVKAADEALYEAKSAGKGVVRLQITGV